MALDAEKILELRQLIADREGRTTRGRLPSSSLSVGIPQGALTEISGTARDEWVISFLRENPALNVFWIEQKLSIFPPGIHQRGLRQGQFLFATPTGDLFQHIRDAVRSQVWQCVVTPSIYTEVKQLKSLQLLAEKGNAAILLLTDNLQSAWPISVQIEVHRGPNGRGFEVELKKNKGGAEVSEVTP